MNSYAWLYIQVAEEIETTDDVIDPLADHLLFAEMLMQHPVTAVGVKSLRDMMSVQELEYMQEMAANRFDQIDRTLRELPREVLLIIR